MGMMEVSFSQAYIEPNVDFPFSHHFQIRISEEVTALVEPSPKFLEKYGPDYELIFNVSAKTGLQDNEIRGPSVFRKAKDVEYTIFLPFDVIIRHPDAPRRALRFLLKGACEVFGRLGIDSTRLLDSQESIIDGICCDLIMLEDPSEDDEYEKRPARRVFEAFFRKRRRR
jgi:hypothetical protein